MLTMVYHCSHSHRTPQHRCSPWSLPVVGQLLLYPSLSMLLSLVVMPMSKVSHRDCHRNRVLGKEPGRDPYRNQGLPPPNLASCSQSREERLLSLQLQAGRTKAQAALVIVAMASVPVASLRMFLGITAPRRLMVSPWGTGAPQAAIASSKSSCVKPFPSL